MSQSSLKRTNFYFSVDKSYKF